VFEAVALACPFDEMAVEYGFRDGRCPASKLFMNKVLLLLLSNNESNQVLWRSIIISAPAKISSGSICAYENAAGFFFISLSTSIEIGAILLFEFLFAVNPVMACLEYRFEYGAEFFSALTSNLMIKCEYAGET